MESKEYYENNGRKVCGILSNPSEKIVPTIILCHGLNSGKDSATNMALSKILSEHGIATFRIDLFAHGESEGNIEDRTLEKFVEDILHALKFLKGKGYSEIGIYGASFGGVASVVAASRSHDIKIMALKATGMGHSRVMANYINDFQEKTWIKAGSTVNIPTLIVHGALDQEVEIECGINLAKSIKSSQLHIFKEADHRFTRKQDFDRSVKLISDFFINNMKK